MHDATFDWPFFDETHRAFASALSTWATTKLPPTDHTDVDASCRALVRALGVSGWLKHAVPAAGDGAAHRLDVRTLCIARETLARTSGLADFAFAMQALGAGPISLFGTSTQRARWLPRIVSGAAIAAFAISEADAGSDVAAMRTTARRDGNDWIIDGEKTWISNGGIADQYVVFCRLADAERAFVALIVEATDVGFSVAERIETIAPHPLGTIRFDACRVPGDRLVGEAGKGLRVALGTLDVFRSTVGAAALGFARRALDASVAHASTRHLFGKPLAEFQLTQAKIADMAVAIDASALLVYRAAWMKDRGAARVTREAAMAKLFATDGAQRVIDDAVQLLGARGLVAGHPVEMLYREIRALRIYEGTSEVQRLIIAEQVMSGYASTSERSA